MTWDHATDYYCHPKYYGLRKAEEYMVNRITQREEWEEIDDQQEKMELNDLYRKNKEVDEKLF